MQNFMALITLHRCGDLVQSYFSALPAGRFHLPLLRLNDLVKRCLGLSTGPGEWGVVGSSVPVRGARPGASQPQLRGAAVLLHGSRRRGPEVSTAWPNRFP